MILVFSNGVGILFIVIFLSRISLLCTINFPCIQSAWKRSVNGPRLGYEISNFLTYLFTVV